MLLFSLHLFERVCSSCGSVFVTAGLRLCWTQVSRAASVNSPCSVQLHQPGAQLRFGHLGFVLGDSGSCFHLLGREFHC